MLAADFLADDVVRRLPARHALALAGMIARADNLGRLPGEPDVLLSYLFAPKKPRADFDEAMIEETLTILAKEGVVRWYFFDGTRYVALSKWRDHQKIRQDLLKSDLPDPEDGAEVVPDDRLVPPRPKPVPPAAGAAPEIGGTPSGGTPEEGRTEVEVEVEEEEEVQGATSPSLRSGDVAPVRDPEEAKDRVRALCSGLASGKAIPARKATLADDVLAPAWEWVERYVPKKEQVGAMKFVGWLRKTGTFDPEVLLALVKHFVVHRPKNGFAYYSGNGTARAVIARRVVADREVAAHEKRREEEAAFFGQKPRPRRG